MTINIGNGHFKIASSRERLENNDDNKLKQEKILSECSTNIDKIISLKINNTSLKLADRISNKLLYSGLNEIKSLRIQLGDKYELVNDMVYLSKAINYRYCRRGRRGSVHFETDNRTNLNTNTVIFSSTESDNTLARKLNHYLESNKDRMLVRDTEISVIPNHEILFTERLDADSLPLPPKKTAQRVQKSTRDAICWEINSNGSRSQMTVERLNNLQVPVVLVDEVTTESKELSAHIMVVNVPKCNKNLILKKGMTVEQGKKYLLSKHKEDAVGLDTLPHGWEKVNVLKKFKRKKSTDPMQRYLFANFPALKVEHDAMKSELIDLMKKYPLIIVLGSLGHYSNNSIKIVTDEINKQSKEN